MQRREFLRGLAGGALAAAGWPYLARGRAADTSGAARPNVVFIYCDDLGWGDLGCYGNDRIRTPHLDQMARDGLRLTNFYVASPVCSPSRVACMTGQYPARHRVHYALSAATKHNAQFDMPDFLDPQVPTVTRMLQQAGYRVGHFGKWHLGATHDPAAPPPEAYGIDESRTFLSTGAPLPQHEICESSATIVDASLDFIQRNQAGPFYANVWLKDPHALLLPSAEQMAGYERWSPSEGPHEGAMRIYYAVVTEIDRQVGRLLTRLDELGLRDNTLVIFSSDNGPAPIWGFNTSHSGAGSVGPFRGCKASLYEGGIRVPFIARWPGHVPANVVDRQSVAGTVDLMPTLATLTGATLPEGHLLDGQDVTAMLAGRPWQRSKPLLWQYRYGPWGRHIQKSPALAIRDGNWKLMMNPDGSRLALYDLEACPNETDSVAETHPEVVARLREPLLAWHGSLPGLDSWPAGAGSEAYPWPAPLP